MTHSTPVLDRPAAERLLTGVGFNPLDIECVLDLIAPRTENGTPVWPARSLERLAVRAYWIGEREFAVPCGHAVRAAA